jgi:catechol-2,3-dioxygenase
LTALGALIGQSDHGATKSLYARDPDGNEFEVMWMLPSDQWGAYDRSAPIRPLDLEREVAQHGGSGAG